MTEPDIVRGEHGEKSVSLINGSCIYPFTCLAQGAHAAYKGIALIVGLQVRRTHSAQSNRRLVPLQRLDQGSC